MPAAPDAADELTDASLALLLLTDAEMHAVRPVLSSCLPDARVWVFGSRATGRARPFSDLDLLVLAHQPLGWLDRAALRDVFEASDLPFRVDVVDVRDLAPGMRERVDAEKVLLIGR